MPIYRFNAMDIEADDIYITVNEVNEEMAIREAINMKRQGVVADVDLGSCELDEYSNEWMIP